MNNNGAGGRGRARNSDETRGKAFSERSSRVRDNNEKHAGTMKTMPARLSPPCCRGRMKKPGAVSRPGVMRSFR
jgi:hypothetical protein